MSDNLTGPDQQVADDPVAGTTEAAPAVDDTATEAATLEYSDDAPTAEDADAIESGEPSDATGEGDEGPAHVFYDIEGEEIPLETIQQWKSGHMMQSDYTKKSQALADERKQFSEQRQSLDQKLQAYGEVESELEQVILGDLSEVNMDELMQSDPSEYLRVQKLLADKKETLSKLMAKRAEQKNALYSEYYQSLHTNMGWDDGSKESTDKQLITAFAKRKEVPPEVFSTFLHPSIMEAFIIAEQALQLKEKAPEVSKRVVKTPKTAKPSGNTKPAQPKSIAERLYGT